MEALSELVYAAEDNCCVVLDALEAVDDIKKFQAVLDCLVGRLPPQGKTQVTSKIRIATTYRREESKMINIKLAGYKSTTIQVDAKEVNKDIGKYIESNTQLAEIPDPLRTEIKNAILERSEGMYVVRPVLIPTEN